MEIKRISKERFLYHKENIGLLNRMVHSINRYKTEIIGDEKLSEEIRKLGIAVLEFEKNTGLIIEVE